MTNAGKAKQITNAFYIGEVSEENERIIREMLNKASLEAMQWKDKQHKREKQKLIDDACKWLELNDSYAKPTHLQVDRLREYLNNIK